MFIFSWSCCTVITTAHSWPMSLAGEIYFNCRNCLQTGYGPFELNRMSGFQLTVKLTKSDYSESFHVMVCKDACNGCSIQHAPHQLYSFGRPYNIIVNYLASSCPVLHCQVLKITAMYCRCPLCRISSAVQIWCRPVHTCLVVMQALSRQSHLKPHCQTYTSNLAMALSSHPCATL